MPDRSSGSTSTGIHAVGARGDVRRGPPDGLFGDLLGVGVTAGPDEGVDPGVDEEPVGGGVAYLGEPVGVPPLVLESALLGVLQVAADGTGLQQPLHQLPRREPVPALDVRGHRHVDGPHDPGHRREHLVGRGLSVLVAESGGDARAGRGECREPGLDEDAGTGGVPRSGQDERVAGCGASVQGS